MAEKVFHPTMDGSRVETLEPKYLELCGTFLHDLGWLTQQGSFDQAADTLRWWHENYPADFLKACANGLTLILDSVQ